MLWNSLKFTNEWWKVEIIATNSWDFIKVCVKDAWVWIPEDKIKTIFEKFSQVDSHLQRNYNWTGLWLSIVKMIVERMWWQVYVESEIWKWSNFFFTLKK